MKREATITLENYVVNVIAAMVGGIIGIIVAALALSLEGLAVANLWGWFIVPLGVKALSIPQAIGVSGLLWVMTYVYHPRSRHELLVSMAMNVVNTMQVLLIGYILATYFM